MSESTDIDKTEPADRWTWTEASDEEFEARRGTEVYYRIYRLEGEDPVNVYKFWAEGDAEAERVLDEYKASHEGEFFYSTSGYCVDSDGKRHDSFRDSMRRFGHEGMAVKVLDFFRYTLPRRLGDFWFWAKDVAYFARHGHSMTEWWSLDSHMLEDLRFNLDKLIEGSHGCPTFMCERARKRLGTESAEPEVYDKKEMDLAMELWREELRELRKHVLLNRYYEGFGIVDDDDDEMAEVEMEYRNTLPYRPGTNKEFDYEKLHKMADQHWNAVWDWIKEYGGALWD